MVTLELPNHLIKYCLRSYDGVDHVCVACKMHKYVFDEQEKKQSLYKMLNNK